MPDFEREDFRREETVEERIAGLEAVTNQMRRMVEENIRKIAEGDDVEGRTYLKGHLETEIAKNEKELERLRAEQ